MAEKMITPAQEESDIGPARISFSTFLLKLLAGSVGGSVGTLVLLVIFLVASSFLQPLTEGLDEYVSPIFVFFLMVMIFLSSTIANLLSVFLISLTERDKYKRVKTAVSQIFSLSVIIFILMVPVYFLTAAVDVSVTVYAIALHIIISAQVSAMILEIVSNYRYSLVGLYGITFSILFSAMILFSLYGLVGNPTILLFMAIPVVWGSIALIGNVTTMIYGWIARTYDKDFLSTQTVYGDDYGKEVEEPEDRTPRAVDEEGADFLRHN